MATWNLTDSSNLFKIKYGPLSMNTYNSANVLLGRCKKSFDFVGKRMDIAVPTSFSGGVGSGSLPTANFGDVQDAIITAKKMYAVVQVEREAIKASATDEGAFVRMTKHAAQKGTESFMRNMSRALFHDASGSLGTFSGSQAGTATVPIVTIVDFKEANWEENDYVNVNADSSVFEVTTVAPTTGLVTLTRISGALDLTAIGAGTHTIYMQNSSGNDPEGLKGVLDATSGSKYSVSIARRWQATQVAAASAGLTTDIMNQTMLEVQRKCGKVPNLIITSFTQYRKLLNILEDQKEYVIDPRASELKGKVSFRGVEFMSSAGPVGVFPERFCDDARMYFLNDNYIELYHRPDFGWFDDDGVVFLRTTSDSYEARYGGYLQAYIPPSFHGVVTGLAT